MLILEAWVDIKSMHRQGRSIRSIANVGSLNFVAESL